MSSAQSRCRRAAWWGMGAVLLSACTHAAPAARDAPADDSVEVGYGTQSRRGVTGSIATVDLDERGGGHVAHVEELLENRVAGVSVRRLPGGGFSVRVRGAAARFGVGEPLFVVDGVPLIPSTRALIGINPRDVARIEVLKDASAAAIYGSRGGNGVILITTRKR